MKMLESHQKILAILLACPKGLFKVSLAAALFIPEHVATRPLAELFQHGFIEARRSHEADWTVGTPDSDLPSAWSCRYRLTESGKRAAAACENN